MTEPMAACVLTQSCFETDAARVAQTVGERFAHLGVAAEVRIAPTPGATRYVLGLDGVEVMVIYTGQPIEEDVLRGLAHTLLEAEPPPTAHRDRAIVTLFQDKAEGHEATIRGALAILKVACVLAETDDAMAVYWLPSEMLMSAAFFTRILSNLKEPEDRPTAVLGHFVPYAEGDGFERRHGIAVVGLHRFIGRDIEFTPSALSLEVLFHHAHDASDWLMRHGPVFKDGDTCGGSATEVIRIRHKDRGRISPHPVLEMTLDPSDVAKRASWSN